MLAAARGTTEGATGSGGGSTVREEFRAVPAGTEAARKLAGRRSAGRDAFTELLLRDQPVLGVSISSNEAMLGHF